MIWIYPALYWKKKSVLDTRDNQTLLQLSTHALGCKILCGHTQILVARMSCIIKGIGSVYKRHPVTKFEHGNHEASKRKFNHMTVY